MVSFHVFGLQKCHFRRRKEKKKHNTHTHTQKKVGMSIEDPVRGRDAPIIDYSFMQKGNLKNPWSYRIIVQKFNI